MTPVSQDVPSHPISFPPHSSHPSHSPRHTMLDASSQSQHDDFLGTSQDLHDQLDDPLNLGLFDNYSFTIREDSSQYAADATNVDSSDFSNWPSSESYPRDSLLFANTTSPYLNNLSLHSSSSSVVNPGATHDSYHPQALKSMYSTPNITRNLPDIRVQTEPTLLSTPSPSYDPHSPYLISPASHSPLGTLPPHTYYGGSPSSIGSAPPITPETPFRTVPSLNSPFINQSSASPVSPSFIIGHTVGFDPKETLAPPSIPRELGVIDMAAAAGHPHGGPFVPQKPYRPHTVSDRRRYVDEVQLEAPIMFYTTNPTGCGIFLKDAIASRFSNLQGRDDSMFEGRGPSVSIRLNWPGYASWSRQIPTRDFRSPPHPITRAKLARNVAKTILRFIQEMETQALEDPSEARWRVGSRAIRLEDLVLVGLQHVSMGSWQAHVRLVRRH